MLWSFCWITARQPSKQNSGQGVQPLLKGILPQSLQIEGGSGAKKPRSRTQNNAAFVLETQAAFLLTTHNRKGAPS